MSAFFQIPNTRLRQGFQKKTHKALPHPQMSTSFLKHQNQLPFRIMVTHSLKGLSRSIPLQIRSAIGSDQCVTLNGLLAVDKGAYGIETPSKMVTPLQVWHKVFTPLKTGWLPIANHCTRSFGGYSKFQGQRVLFMSCSQSERTGWSKNYRLPSGFSLFEEEANGGRSKKLGLRIALRIPL